MGRTLERKKEIVVGYRKKLHNEEFHNQYFSPNIFSAIKLRTMRRVSRWGK
jgi:hypothetical protein